MGASCPTCGSSMCSSLVPAPPRPCACLRALLTTLSKVSRRTPVLIAVALAGEQRKESRLCSPGTLCFGTTPPSLETYTSAGYAYLLCRLVRSISSLHHRRNFPFYNCPQGLKPQFMRAAPPRLCTCMAMHLHRDATARRCTCKEMRVDFLLACSAG